MMRIALLSCTSRKKYYPCKAAEMYSASPRFELAYAYAKQVADVVYILSAKYGLLAEDDIIEPYNETLIHKKAEVRKSWTNQVIKDLVTRHSLESDEYVLLVGQKYYEFLIPKIKNFELPLRGMPMGMWIPKLRELIKNQDGVNEEKSKSFMLHELLTQLQRYNWESIDQIPFDNGIYIMFEVGEKYFGMDRIVRIGTHIVDGRLKVRLIDHFIRENKDGSILRKNIGLALLHKNQDPFETIWAQNWSRPEVRNEYLDHSFDQTKRAVEGMVSVYLRENVQFACIRVDGEIERLKIEGTLIATLNRAIDFKCSDGWLGRYSPKPEISTSGLWNSQGLKSNELSYHELIEFRNFVLNGKSLERNATERNVVIVESVQKRTDKMVAKKEIKASISDIKAYIQQIIDEALHDGQTFVDIVSGDVHRQMKLANKMPSVCSAMYQLMGERDVVLHTTPSGKSSTIKIRYFL